MKKKGLFCFTLLFFFLSFAPASAEPVVSVVKVGDPSIAIVPGDALTIDIEVNDAQGLAGCAFTLRYPADVLELTGDQITSSFFGLFTDHRVDPPVSEEPWVSNEESAGTVHLSGAYIDAATGGGAYSGQQTLFTLHFRVKDEALTSDYDFQLQQTMLFHPEAGWGGDHNDNGIFDEGVDQKEASPVLMKACADDEEGCVDYVAIPCSFEGLSISVDGGAAPAATTGAASSVGWEGVTFNGVVNPNRLSTAVTFEYGADTSYGSTVTAGQSPVSGEENIPASASVVGLNPDTTYHFRIVGQNAAGTAYGADFTFHTKARDTDNDGMPDDWETQNNLDPADPADGTVDSDQDGLSNIDEFHAGTDPGRTDSDGDGLSDSWETVNGLDPTMVDSDGNGTHDGAEDPDGDAYSNLVEYLAGTHPNDPASKPKDPVADAGPQQLVKPGDRVILNGLNSSVADGILVTYTWEQVAGEAVVLESKTDAHCSFITGASGGLEFMLTVTDNKGLTNTDTVVINVSESALSPIAYAGGALRFDSDSTATLDGSESKDPDGTIIGYFWEQIEGDPVALSDVTEVAPTFDTTGLSGQRLTFRLTVTDDDGLKASDHVVVNIASALVVPVANAGEDQSFDEGQTVALDASGSMDPSGAPLRYRWTQIGGPTVILSDIFSEKPTFVIPGVEADGVVLLFRLTVMNSIGLSGADTVDISVNNRHELPVAAGAPVVGTNGSVLAVATGLGAGITELHSIDPVTIPGTENMPDEIPYGLLDFKVRTTPGETAQVTIMLPEPAGEKAGWFKYSALTGWSDFTAHAEFNSDRSMVTLSLTDGGAGDADGTVNGEIVDPSGLGVKASESQFITDTSDSVTETESSDSSGGGGCFIKALLKKD